MYTLEKTQDLSFMYSMYADTLNNTPFYTHNSLYVV